MTALSVDLGPVREAAQRATPFWSDLVEAAVSTPWAHRQLTGPTDRRGEQPARPRQTGVRSVKR